MKPLDKDGGHFRFSGSPSESNSTSLDVCYWAANMCADRTRRCLAIQLNVRPAQEDKMEGAF